MEIAALFLWGGGGTHRAAAASPFAQAQHGEIRPPVS